MRFGLWVAYVATMFLIGLANILRLVIVGGFILTLIFWAAKIIELSLLELAVQYILPGLLYWGLSRIVQWLRAAADDLQDRRGFIAVTTW